MIKMQTNEQRAAGFRVLQTEFSAAGKTVLATMAGKRAANFEMDLSITLQPDGYFCAIDRNNYDVDCDHTGFFTRSPQGYGRTPLDAIVDLIDNTAEG